MMPTLSARVKDLWLDNAISPAINEIESYQKALNQVSEFAYILDELGWPHSQAFHSWVDNAPKIWLNKRRETILDWTRNQLALGKLAAH
jgi:centromere/kinetochore protein ZW10